MAKVPKIALVGQPNSGKSTIFNAIAGFKAKTSNLPGTTIKYTVSRINVGGRVADLVDLPGIYSLASGGPVETETLRFLLSGEIDVLINVVDSSLLSRSLEFTLELMELGIPMVIALNMFDEAKAKGIEIDVEKLTKLLKIPAIPTVAVKGKGIVTLLIEAFRTMGKNSQTPPKVSPPVEEAIEKIRECLEEDAEGNLNVSTRLFAIKILEGDNYFLGFLKIKPEELSKIEEVKRNLQERFKKSPDLIIHHERHLFAMSIYEEAVTIKRTGKISLEEKVDHYLMHPVFGYFALLIIFVAFFFLIFSIGSPLEEILISPLEKLRVIVKGIPISLLSSILDGLVQGVGGGLAIVLPYFVPLVFFTSFLEDLGYLPRAAFLLDTFMHKIGLHGKSVVPFILSYGCTVPSVTATRMLESERERTVTALLIPIIPCSARTTVILALMAFYLGPIAALSLYFLNILVIAVVGKILSFFFPLPSPGIMMEIPPYRMPSFSITLKKTWLGLKDFISFAWPILIVGSIFLSILQLLGFDKIINFLLSPYTSGFLGLPKEVGLTLIFGILRKELALIMLLQALGTTDVLQVITARQIIVFTLFITFFVPCISTLAILYKEFGKKIVALSFLINTILASVIAFIARIV
jgi:ferrous iron transport protein B